MREMESGACDVKGQIELSVTVVSVIFFCINVKQLMLSKGAICELVSQFSGELSSRQYVCAIMIPASDVPVLHIQLAPDP